MRNGAYESNSFEITKVYSDRSVRVSLNLYLELCHDDIEDKQESKFCTENLCFYVKEIRMSEDGS